MSFGEAINISITGIESSGWQGVLDTIKAGYKVYSDSKEIFKRADDYGDDETPTNEDEGSAIAMRFNGNFGYGSNYAKAGEPDIGLMEGSLLYLRSQLNKPDEPISIGTDLVSAQSKKLPLVKIKPLNLKKRKAQII